MKIDGVWSFCRPLNLFRNTEISQESRLCVNTLHFLRVHEICSSYNITGIQDENQGCFGSCCKCSLYTGLQLPLYRHYSGVFEKLRNTIISFVISAYPSVRVNGRTRLPLDGISIYEGWNFNSGNYLFTTDTK